MRSFRQVDVFSAEPFLGNPVAVVHDADGLSEEQMAAFARWTNLSETTFLMAPTKDGADYRLRIWTPGGELPFAGHPTLGSAHAWLEAGGRAVSDDVVVQECGAGLVTVRRGDRLAFAGPPLLRSGPLSSSELIAAALAVGVAPDDVLDAAWLDNGPGWMGLLLRDAAAVLACRLDRVAAGGLKIGVVGVHPAGTSDALVEVRAFAPSLGVGEDPVTGSLNAGVGAWLGGSVLPASYVAAQGTAIGRRGRVHVAVEDTPDERVVWVGGETRTTITGTVDL